MSSPPNSSSRGRAKSQIPANPLKHERPKQYTAKSHNRSLSYGKNLNKTASLDRPKMNRSKSSDMLLAKGKRVRSFTKLTGLQPLTKTNSNQSIASTGNGKGLKSNNDKPTFNRSYNGDVDVDDNDGEDDVDDEKDEEDEEDEEDGDGFENTGSPVQRSSKVSQYNERVSVKDILEGTHNAEIQKQPQVYNDALTCHRESHENISDAGTNSSNENFSNQLYGGSLLLSQSTGVEKKVGSNVFTYPNNITTASQPEITNQMTALLKNGISQVSNGSKKLHSSSIESINSGISFKAKPSKPEAQVTPQSKKLAPNNKMVAARQHSNNNNNNNNSTDSPNFNQFLKSGPSNVETRAQQRLWLQRENSLLDVANDNPNSPHKMMLIENTIESRTEFERLGREYLNVKRYLNPVVDSLKRVETIRGVSENKTMAKTRNNRTVFGRSSEPIKKKEDTFASFAPDFVQHEDQIHIKLNRLWQDTWKSASSTYQTMASNATPQSINNNPINYQNGGLTNGNEDGSPMGSSVRQQNQANLRLETSSTNQRQQNAYFPNLRSPTTPTTRAVKKAEYENTSPVLYQAGLNLNNNTNISNNIRLQNEQIQKHLNAP